MALIGRIAAIFLACFAAIFAAGSVVTVAVLLPAWSDLALETFDESTFAIVVAFGAIFVSGFALLPALLVIVLGEAFAIRAMIYYALAGAIVAGFLYLSFRGFDTLALRVNGFARRELEIMAAAGIVAGFVYWMIAGRTAGKWKESSGSSGASRLR